MIKHTVEISSSAVHLATDHRQLRLKRDGQIVGSMPCEDVGVVLVDHPGTTYTHNALTALVDSQAVVVLCGRDHLPCGLLMPLGDHSEVVSRLRDQLGASEPLKKRLWKQLVMAKIRGQAANLPPDSVSRRRLLVFADEVRSGDPTNREAQASRVYWKSWLTESEGNDFQVEIAFRRDREGAWPNALLNYGYAVVRAAVARSLVAAGLHPSLGLHHSNRSNAFCLADDLVEPLRPIVDRRVRELFLSGAGALDQSTKAELLDLLSDRVRMSDAEGPLMVALHRMAASLVACYRREAKNLEIPRPC